VAMHSVLRKKSLLRGAIKKLVIVDISLNRPIKSSERDDKMYKLILAMIEIDSLKLTSRSEIIDKLKKVEDKSEVVNFLLLNLRRDPTTQIFSFSKLALKEILLAWPILVESWKPIKATEFVPWEGEALFLCGEKSDYVTDRDISEIKYFFPNSEIERIPNSGHLPHLDNPNEFNKKLQKFLLRE
jgi:esterase